MTHTPGPWTSGPADQFYNLRVYADARPYVASVYSTNRLHCDEACTANAALIAAAPDMYEALKATLPYLEGFAEDYDAADPDEQPIIKPIVDAARAALAKAEGRS